jgi:hypothetical protein
MIGGLRIGRLIADEADRLDADLIVLTIRRQES